MIKGFIQNMLLQLATQLMNTLLFQQFDQKGHYSPCWFLPQDQSTGLKDIQVHIFYFSFLITLDIKI